MKIILAIVFFLLEGNVFAATDQTIPSAKFLNAGQIGFGFDDVSLQLSLSPCIVGEISTDLVQMNSTPFSAPTIITQETNSSLFSDEIMVVFSAYSQWRKDVSLKPINGPALSNAICGNSYIQSVQIAGVISVQAVFQVTSGSVNEIAGILSHVASLRQLLDVAEQAKILLRNLSVKSSGGVNETQRLADAEKDCFLKNLCRELIDVAYSEASKLDYRYPKERVRDLNSNERSEVGGIVHYITTPYAVTKNTEPVQ